MEQDLFRQLNAGTKFDAKRCGEETWNLFRHGTRASSVQRNDNFDDKLTLCEIPADLDFFADSSDSTKKKTASQQDTKQTKKENDNESKKKKKKKRKRRKKKENASNHTTTTAKTTTTPSLLLLRRSSNNNDNNNIPEETEESRHRKNEIRELRGRMNIKVKGDGVPDPCATFEEFPLRRSIRRVILDNVEKSQYKEPTPIQMQAIPIMLDGRDILAAAPTGSGKTLAFLIPCLDWLASSSHQASQNKSPRALILAPTRELAVQIHREAQRMSVGKKLKLRVLDKSTAASIRDAQTDLLIATPMRLVHLLRRDEITLSQVGLMIMDEADKLLDMGFLEQTDEIMARCDESNLRRALFSATLPEGVEELARTVLRNPIRVVIGTRNACNELIDQNLLFVGRENGKLVAMRQLVAKGLKPPCLIFVQNKERAMELYRELAYDGLNIDTLHSDRTQRQRDEVVRKFRSGKTWILIATDLVGRGVDFKGVNTVINYDFPISATNYVHRIGRTGRAGRKGKAVTLFTEYDMPMLRSIANVMRLSGCEVPDWMLRMKKLRRQERKMVERRGGIRRYNISSGASKWDRDRAAKRRNMIAQSKQQSKKKRRRRRSSSGGSFDEK